MFDLLTQINSAVAEKAGEKQKLAEKAAVERAARIAEIIPAYTADMLVY